MERKPISAFIVDDEEDGREVLQHLLSAHPESIQVVGQAATAQQAAQMIPELMPDLVFLDVQMPGRNGFDLLADLSPIGFEVIFVTSFAEYALSAIKFNALDYLLKPLDEIELATALAKATSRIAGTGGSGKQIESLLDSLQKKPSKIALHRKGQVWLVEICEILYVEAMDNYCQIETQKSGQFIMTRTLTDFVQYLGEGSQFIRISKGVLINTQHIDIYSKGEPCMISMSDGKVFEVSRRKKQEVLAELKFKLLLSKGT